MNPTSTAKDGAPVRFPPPFVPLVALAIGALAQHFVRALPLPWGAGLRYPVGALLVAGAAGVIAAAIRLFKSSGQDPKPWKSTPEVIADGIYRWTRNPMYLGMGLMQAGIAVLLDNAWMLALVPMTWAVIYQIAIRHEESYLESKFGAGYTRYKHAVRRWL